MLPLIPEKLDDWDNKTLNSLVVLNDIENERFDFKALEFSKLYDDICGMANTSGGHLVLGVVEVKNEKGQFLEFKKEGFDKGQKRKIENGINSAIAQVEPSPSTAEWRNIEDEGKLYPVIKIEGVNYQKPYFLKGSGQCYIRAGASSIPASRSTVINLLSDHIQRKYSILRLRAACRDLEEQIHYTSEDIEKADPREGASIIKPLNLNFIQNSVLDTEWLFLKNDLHGYHINENSIAEGYYSFYNKLERLNLAINTFNQHIDPFNQEFFFILREKIKNKEMKFWNPSEDNAKKAILFLEHIITLCNKFENYK